MRTPVNKFENKLRVVYRLDITNPHRKGLRCTIIMATIMATMMTSMSSITIGSHLMEVYTLCKGDVYDYVGYQGPSWSWRRRGGNHHCFWCHLIMVEITNTSSLSTLNTIRRDWASYSWWRSIDANKWWRSVGLKGEVDELCRN